MTSPSRDRVREVAALVKADAFADVQKWEGKPVTGPNVAEMHGETMAMIAALAECILALSE